jgi:hypothetical protein
MTTTEQLFGGCTDEELLRMWLGPRTTDALAAAAELRSRRELARFDGDDDGTAAERRAADRGLSIDLEIEQAEVAMTRAGVPMRGEDGATLAWDQRVSLLAARNQILEKALRDFLFAIGWPLAFTTKLRALELAASKRWPETHTWKDGSR